MDKNRANGRRQKRRKFRVRKRLQGTAERPRLCVTRSNKNIGVQLIDDAAGATITAASTLDKALSKEFKYGGNKDSASAVGKLIAERAAKAGVKKVCFDRGPYKYHGRVEALASAAREGGLEF